MCPLKNSEAGPDLLLSCKMVKIFGQMFGANFDAFYPTDTQHQFNARESDWGFPSFMPLGQLYDPARGYLVNDTIVVEADVAVHRVVDYWAHDSKKKKTGYVGLKNQGATGYMNTLLQTLYHIPYFKKAVYHMPTTENDMPSGSITLASQSLFYKLRYSDTSVATKELTKSFGWDTYDCFMQHDVQELNRVLCEKLEDKMKGTVVEGTIQRLFEGHHMSYIECINVDYKSTRKESFYDLQLDVKGCHDVYASFDKYVEVERLEGDNMYHAEQFGLQDARKGVLFIDFPPVLQLQLKRFEYDFMRDTMVKVSIKNSVFCHCLLWLVGWSVIGVCFRTCAIPFFG
ncbi:ubiquitin carboxyl-terminal hydrolase 12-like [Camellia sinensis]|uniref:ubiquitin carboxyl-terminal hydrolase 12-like n=1 Tax=Camellia sinensis TaxID=4442 RepID=UPI001036E783|nr:ubiquitin carboxyl-terminal hydrolase 12-like [Camellia sinensis]